ncbi:MAG: HAD-IIA family hydrolase [bacterium]|nr:HAD-IIA family hydrolase [bacterium]
MTIVIFDLDGVLYRGNETIPEAATCVDTLRDRGIIIGYLTNNAGRTRESVVERLAEHGIDAKVIEVMTSAEATARYLTEKGFSGKRIYVIGGEGLTETLRRHGFVVDTEDVGDPCDFVVIGWDRGISFNKIARAQNEIMVNKAKFIASNKDAMFPADGGRVLPGAGAMVAAVEAASNTKAEVIGKPEIYSLKYLIDDLCGGSDISEKAVWVIGDRLDTDIACGNSFGAITVCVTTGITSREDAEKAERIFKPEYVIDSLSELPGLITC